MELEYLGHACFAFHTSHRTLIVDPYESGQFGGQMAYRPIDVPADWVVCSHEHADHAARHAVPGSPARLEQGVAGPFTVTRFALSHDEYRGRRRGGLVSALRIEAEGARVLHLSDVGQAPDPAVVQANRGIDVLLIPVGGVFTIGAAQAWEWIERLQPRTAIPIHYRTTACSLPIRGAEAFRGWVPNARLWNSHRIQVQDSLPDRLIVAPRLA